MRIISGSKKGMAILSPTTDGTRPITDRVKESVFNILFKYGPWEDKTVADVFCGTGSLGLECLSRGAERVVFYENDPRVVSVLEKNVERGGFVERAIIRRANGFRFGAGSLPGVRTFDVIFIDPPYRNSADTAVDSLLGKLLANLPDALAPGGVAVVRTHEKAEVLEEYGRLRLVDRRVWGTQAVAFMEAGGGQEGADDQ